MYILTSNFKRSNRGCARRWGGSSPRPPPPRALAAGGSTARASSSSSAPVRFGSAGARVAPRQWRVASTYSSTSASFKLQPSAVHPASRRAAARTRLAARRGESGKCARVHPTRFADVLSLIHDRTFDTERRMYEKMVSIRQAEICIRRDRAAHRRSPFVHSLCFPVQVGKDT